jgi:MoaA/NifB/PqqE/SkfB family radical SAM enzyme
MMGNGEPLMNPALLDFLEVLKKYSVWVGFNTNGTLLHERMGRELIRLGLDKLDVSIDSTDPKTFERIRKGASFDRVIDNIMRLKALKSSLHSHKPDVSIETVLMKDNIEELDRIVELAHKAGGQYVHFEPLYWKNEEDYLRLFNQISTATVDKEVIRDNFEKAAAKAKELNITVQIPWHLTESDPGVEIAPPSGEGGPAVESNAGEGNPMKSEPDPPACNPCREDQEPNHDEKKEGQNKGLMCTEPWATLFITWQGEVKTCCASEKRFGNLYEQPIQEIWYGRDYQIYRKLISKRIGPLECSTCLQNPNNQPNIVEQVKSSSLVHRLFPTF